MAIIGFSFSRFDCERSKSAAKGNIEITHNISIKNVEKTTLKVGGNDNPVLKIDFVFDVIYGNDLGKVGISGDVIFSDTKEIINETYKGWEADKKLNEMVNEQVHRFIYNKTIVKALELSDSLNLPAPFQLPRISFSGDKKADNKKK